MLPAGDQLILSVALLFCFASGLVCAVNSYQDLGKVVNARGGSKDEEKEEDSRHISDSTTLTVVSQGVPNVYASSEREAKHIFDRMAATGADIFLVQAASESFNSRLMRGAWLQRSDEGAGNVFDVFVSDEPPLSTVTLLPSSPLLYFEIEARSGGLRAGTATVIKVSFHDSPLLVVNAVLNPREFADAPTSALELLIDALPQEDGCSVILAIVFNGTHAETPEGFEELRPPHAQLEHSLFLRSNTMVLDSVRTLNHGFGTVAKLVLADQNPRHAPEDSSTDDSAIRDHKSASWGQSDNVTQNNDHGSGGGISEVVPDNLPTDLPFLASDVVPQAYSTPQGAVRKIYDAVNQASEVVFDIGDVTKSNFMWNLKVESINLMTKMSMKALIWMKTLASLLHQLAANFTVH